MPSSDREGPVDLGARPTLVLLGVVLGWIWLYNVQIKGQSIPRGFVEIVDTLAEDLVLGSLVTVCVGVGILVVFTVTKLYSQIVARPGSFRILETMVADFVASGDGRALAWGLLRFAEQPVPSTVRPQTVGGMLTALSLVYGMSWVYLVLFSEALFFVCWSAGVDLPITAENLELLPTIAVAIPFSARVMAYLRYPYAQDYADFMPGAVFVLLLVGTLGFLFQSDDQKFFLLQVWRDASYLETFVRGGLILAFIPVFTETLFWLGSEPRAVDDPSG